MCLWGGGGGRGLPLNWIIGLFWVIGRSLYGINWNIFWDMLKLKWFCFCCAPRINIYLRARAELIAVPEKMNKKVPTAHTHCVWGSLSAYFGGGGGWPLYGNVLDGI